MKNTYSRNELPPFSLARICHFSNSLSVKIIEKQHLKDLRINNDGQGERERDSGIEKKWGKSRKKERKKERKNGTIQVKEIKISYSPRRTKVIIVHKKALTNKNRGIQYVEQCQWHLSSLSVFGCEYLADQPLLCAGLSAMYDVFFFFCWTSASSCVQSK